MADKITTILDMDLTSGVTATSTGPSAPGAPGTLSLAAGSPAYTVITLSWSVPSDIGQSTITGYRIKKDGVVLVADTGSAATTYSATGLTNSTAYNFTVAAINAYGTGPDGNTPSLTTGAYEVPGTPGTLSLAAGSPDSSVIDLSWSAPASDGGQTISGYRIQNSTDGSSWSDVVANTGSTATTYSNTGLTGSTTYHYRVAAINSVGTGGYGNAPSLTTGDPVMTYSTTGSPTERTYGIYKSLHWTGAGNFVITANPKALDIWIVSGGGGGGGGYYSFGGGGGGGAGGAKAFTSQTVSVGTHVITIGQGGTGGANGGAGSTDGGDSSFAISGGSTLSTTGGGAGVIGTGRAGGSGAGGQGNSTGQPGQGVSGEGNAGGTGDYNGGSWPTRGGGGGGKGGVGASGTTGPGGGPGGLYGTNYYADGNTSGTTDGIHRFAEGGGGGGSSNSSGSGGSGNGDGGGGAGGVASGTGSAGRHGVVIIRWVV